MQLTAIVRKGESQYVALCPEVDVVSQGYTIEESLTNLREAVEVYMEEMGVSEGMSFPRNASFGVAEASPSAETSPLHRGIVPGFRFWGRTSAPLWSLET